MSDGEQPWTGYIRLQLDFLRSPYWQPPSILLLFHHVYGWRDIDRPIEGGEILITNQ